MWTMAKIVKAPESLMAYLTCQYCANLNFKRIQDFVRHLRDHHCSREGGSFVCRYGYNGVCSSLPLEGVSDKDYIAHATKHATMQQRQNQQEKSNGQMVDGTAAWTVYSSSQNLPAVLNDPNRGKQSNFLTKTWGDAFVEKVEIPKSPYLPEVMSQHFESYMKKIARIAPRLGLHPGGLGVADSSRKDDSTLHVREGMNGRPVEIGVNAGESTSEDLAALDRLITYLLAQPSGNLENWRRSRRASARGYRQLRPNGETTSVPAPGVGTTPL